jgi:hypothetical protein
MSEITSKVILNWLDQHSTTQESPSLYLCIVLAQKQPLLVIRRQTSVLAQDPFSLAIVWTSTFTGLLHFVLRTV